jgi:predicted dehydrogenase
MSPNDVIGIAVQGAGNVSTGHLNAYLRNPRCRVLAIGSRTKEGAAKKAREVGLDPAQVGLYDAVEELLAHPGVDALSICTPHSRHAKDTIAAAHAGKHCLIEKPVAMNLEESAVSSSTGTRPSTPPRR